MALIKCERCGKEISDTMTNCPYCGYEREKQRLEDERKYTGNLSQELTRSLVPAVIVILIAIVSEVLNKRIAAMYGTNFSDAYLISQKCLPLIKRAVILIMVFSLTGLTSYFVLKKIGERKLYRIIIYVAAAILSAILICLVTNNNPDAYIYGHNELYAYVLLLIRSIGVFCGISYGFAAAMTSISSCSANKKYAIVMPVVSIAIYAALIFAKCTILISAFGWGVKGLYPVLLLVPQLLLMIIPCILANIKK